MGSFIPCVFYFFFFLYLPFCKIFCFTFSPLGTLPGLNGNGSVTPSISLQCKPRERQLNTAAILVMYAFLPHFTVLPYPVKSFLPVCVLYNSQKISIALCRTEKVFGVCIPVFLQCDSGKYPISLKFGRNV